MRAVAPAARLRRCLRPLQRRRVAAFGHQVPIGDPVALSATLGYGGAFPDPNIGYGGAFPDPNSAVFYPPSMRTDGAAPPVGGQLPAAFIPGAAAPSAAPAAATAAS